MGRRRRPRRRLATARFDNGSSRNRRRSQRARRPRRGASDRQSARACNVCGSLMNAVIQDHAVSKSPRQSVKFGVFDQNDRSGLPIAQQYEERLALAELLDESGFYAYHMSEHHATPLSTTP